MDADPYDMFEDMTANVEAGLTLAELQKQLVHIHLESRVGQAADLCRAQHLAGFDCAHTARCTES